MKRPTAILLLLCTLILVLLPTLSACENTACKHAYDSSCDAFCNDCNMKRTIFHTFEDATCTSPKTCTVCGETEGDALGHTLNHDNDGTTALVCTVCGITVADSQAHNFESDWQKDTYGHWHACSNENCLATDTKTEHIPNIPEATKEQEKRCTVCGYIIENIKTDITVWIPTNGGTKYHSSPSCSNMKNPEQVSLEYAKAKGFTACKRCH